MHTIGCCTNKAPTAHTSYKCEVRTLCSQSVRKVNYIWVVSLFYNSEMQVEQPILPKQLPPVLTTPTFSGARLLCDCSPAHVTNKQLLHILILWHIWNKWCVSTFLWDWNKTELRLAKLLGVVINIHVYNFENIFCIWNFKIRTPKTIANLISCFSFTLPYLHTTCFIVSPFQNRIGLTSGHATW